jgi:UDP-glucose:(heptosyl)LPS alpha-1,3-glucosyltransferase
MRIAVLLDRFQSGHGGAEIWLARFAASAAARGHEPWLVTRDPRDPRVDDAFVRWVPVACGGGPRFMRDGAFARAADATARAAGAETTLGVRHIHACSVYQPHGGVHRAALEGTLASMEGFAVRAVRRAARAIAPRQRVFLDAEERLLAGGGAERVVALSPRVLADLQRWYPAAAARAMVIPPGIDIERFRPAPPLAAGPPRALFIARQPVLKGLEPLLRALAQVRKGGVDLQLTAAGFEVRGWKRRAEALGVGAAVRFIGFDARPEDLYATSDLLAHPTFYDPCSLVVAEAMACGRPVVTTEANGASHWVTVEAGRVIADPREVSGLAEALAATAASAREPSTVAAARSAATTFGGGERLEEILALLAAAGSRSLTSGT